MSGFEQYQQQYIQQQQQQQQFQQDGSGTGVQSNMYSMPRVIDYLQCEWFKFEVDRAHWQSEKSDLLTKISQLENEKKTQDNIKNDLFKRIKMLEYALYQERLKNNSSYIVPKDDLPQLMGENTLKPKSTKSNITRNLIKKYLKEINSNDFIVSKPEISMNYYNGENNEMASDEQDPKQTTILNVPVMSEKQKLLNEMESGSTSSQLSDQLLNGQGIPPSKISIADIYSKKNNDRGSSIDSFDITSLDSLKKQLDEFKGAPVSPPLTSNENNNDNNSSSGSSSNNSSISSGSVIYNNQNNNDMEPSYDSMNEDFFNKLSNTKGRMKIKKGFKFTESDLNGSGENSIKNGGSIGLTASTNKKSGTLTPVGSLGRRKGMSFDLQGLGASDLNEIKLEDENKSQITDSSPRVWRYKHSLKSHLDGVRSLQFHPSEPILVSASEDSMIKVWNINHLAVTKKSNTPEVEPICTMRGHTGSVFTSTLSDDGKYIYSGGMDTVIRKWIMPKVDNDPYQTHGSLTPFLTQQLIGHSDVVWELVMVPLSNSSRLCSSSADGTIRVWDVNNSNNDNSTNESVGTISLSSIPTSISVPITSPHQIVVGHVDGSLSLLDIESGQLVRQLRPAVGSESQVNKVVTHSLYPMAITGLEDSKIEFWDLASGVAVHSMVAHSDAVSSLTIDPHGLYLASSSHDSSIRFWDISAKTCTQDLTSHRPKYDESIHSLTYHPTKGYFASGGADSIIRIHQ